jgi:hypothetical protein
MSVERLAGHPQFSAEIGDLRFEKISCGRTSTRIFMLSSSAMRGHAQ